MAYVAPSARSTGDLITASIWNQDIVDNAVQHQADIDLMYRRPTLPIVTNGNFQMWQRGTSFAAIASGTYCADRWLYGKSGAMVHTVERSTDVPTVANASFYPLYSLKLDTTTADSSIAAGDVAFIEQRIEGYNFHPIAQRGFTLTFWVKSTVTGTYCAFFRNTGLDRSYVAEYTISQTDTWEFKTINVSASPSAGTWDYTTGVGLRVGFTLASGSTAQTTAGTWQTGNFIATSNQVNHTASTSNDFYLWGVDIYPTDNTTGILAANYGFFKPAAYSQDLLRSGLDLTNARQGIFEPEPGGTLHVTDGRGTLPDLSSVERTLILQNNDTTTSHANITFVGGTLSIESGVLWNSGSGNTGQIRYRETVPDIQVLVNGTSSASFKTDGIQLPNTATVYFQNGTGSVNNGGTATIGSVGVASSLWQFSIWSTDSGTTNRAFGFAQRDSGSNVTVTAISESGFTFNVSSTSVRIINGAGATRNYRYSYVRIG